MSAAIKQSFYFSDSLNASDVIDEDRGAGFAPIPGRAARLFGKVIQELDLVRQLLPDLGQICRAATAKLEHHAVLAGLQFGQQIFRRSKRQRFRLGQHADFNLKLVQFPGCTGRKRGSSSAALRALSWMADRATLVEKCGRCIRAAPRPR